MPLSEAGLTVPTGSEIRDQMKADYEALTGLTLDLTRDDDQFAAVMVSIQAERLGAGYELLQAIYDGTSVDNALGIQLENALLLVGAQPKAATYSQATISCTGTNGTVIPVGSIVEGGGTNDDARWVTTSDITIAGGSTDVVVQAQIAGPTTADIGDIDAIVTAVPGWTSVTNAAAADPGKFRENDSAMRRRRREQLAVDGTNSTAAIKAGLLELDYVSEAAVIQNATNVAATVSGKSMNANSVWVFLNPDSLTSDQIDEITKLLHRKVVHGIEMMVDTTGGSSTYEQKDVTDDGASTSREISWNYGTDEDLYLTVTVKVEAGYALADVSPGVKEALVDHFANSRRMGQVLTEYEMVQAVVRWGVPGLADIDIGAGRLPATVLALPYSPAIDVSQNLAEANITVTL